MPLDAKVRTSQRCTLSESINRVIEFDNQYSMRFSQKQANVNFVQADTSNNDAAGNRVRKTEHREKTRNNNNNSNNRNNAYQNNNNNSNNRNNAITIIITTETIMVSVGLTVTYARKVVTQLVTAN